LFVYDSATENFDSDAHGFATRWVQKAMSLLQTRTRDGIVYAIDARLRPSGRSGPLVTSLTRFTEYHQTEAELWERQAHIRARVVYGSDALAARIDDVVERFVYGAGLDANGVREIHGLRRRIEAELAGEGPRRRNIKTGRGGIVDIEFLVQMLQLRHGRDVPQLRVRGTLAALRALRQSGLMPAEDADRLIADYVFLRRLEARMRLERDRPVEELGTDTRVLRPLARRLGFEDAAPGATLLAAYERSREEVRRLYERYFESVDV
jgi:glutamate-ammonia-ligase adenylyltransferase